MDHPAGLFAQDKPVQMPPMDFDEFNPFIGFKEVWDFEERYAALDEV